LAIWKLPSKPWRCRVIVTTFDSFAGRFVCPTGAVYIVGSKVAFHPARTRPLSNAGLPLSVLRAFLIRLEEPVMVLAAHFVLTVCLILFVEATELLLALFHLENRQIPLIQLTLSEWMFDLDVLIASVVMVVGAARAVVALWRAP
jgi:hypothetical protein